MKSVKTATFNGIKYDVKFTEPVDGICDSPTGARPSLTVFADMDTKCGLESAIHESLHACFWAKTDEKVEQTARDITSLLWRLGYRNVS